jgi:hypothetical protein
MAGSCGTGFEQRLPALGRCAASDTLDEGNAQAHPPPADSAERRGIAEALEACVAGFQWMFSEHRALPADGLTQEDRLHASSAGKGRERSRGFRIA